MTGSSAPNPTLLTAHQKLVELSHHVASFDVRSLEAPDAAERARALGVCLQLAGRAVEQFEAVLGIVKTAFDAAPGPLGLESATLGNTAEETLAESDSLSQLTSLARMEVRRVMDRLAMHEAMSPDHVVYQGSSLHRKVSRGVSVVEGILARTLGVPSQGIPAADLQSSLRVRRVYAWFRRGVDVEVAPQKDDIHRVLRRVGTRIAALIGKREYADLRPDDRILFSRLQSRILHWLGQAQPSFDEGRRLWEDCRAMIDILRQVNLRADLIGHDAAFARDVLLAWPSESGGDQRLSAPLAERFKCLEGLDEHLDRCFANEETPTYATAERVLNRINSLAKSRGL